MFFEVQLVLHWIITIKHLQDLTFSLCGQNLQGSRLKIKTAGSSETAHVYQIASHPRTQWRFIFWTAEVIIMELILNYNLGSHSVGYKSIFWDVMLCSLVVVHQCLGGMYCLHLQGSSVKPSNKSARIKLAYLCILEVKCYIYFQGFCIWYLCQPFSHEYAYQNSGNVITGEYFSCVSMQLYATLPVILRSHLFQLFFLAENVL
jgi:hypothetical protein